MTGTLRKLTAVPPGLPRPAHNQDLAGRLALAEAWNEVLRGQIEVLQAQLDSVTEVYARGPLSRLMRIARAIATVEMVTVEDLRGPSRDRPIAWARQEFMVAARDDGHSLPEIAAFLNRDHTTVMHGIEAAKARAEGRAEALTEGLADG